MVIRPDVVYDAYNSIDKEILKNSRIIISVRQNGEVSFTAGAEIIVKKKSGNNSKYENEQKK